jgi:hypothetical protein
MPLFDWHGVELPENPTTREVERYIRRFKREFANDREAVGRILWGRNERETAEIELERRREFKHKVLVTKGGLIAVNKAIEEEEESMPTGRLTLYLCYGVPKMLVVKSRAG